MQKNIIESKLTGVPDKIDEIYQNDKQPFILDTTGQYAIFLKYKGTIVDFAEYIIKEKMGRIKKEEFVEDARKKLVGSLKIGDQYAWFFDQMQPDIDDIFAGQGWYQKDNLFKPTVMNKEEFYKKQILKPDEDVDFQGNKGYFYKKDEFRFVIVANGKSFDDFQTKLKLPWEKFELIKII